MMTMTRRALFAAVVGFFAAPLYAEKPRRPYFHYRPLLLTKRGFVRADYKIRIRFDTVRDFHWQARPPQELIVRLNSPSRVRVRYLDSEEGLRFLSECWRFYT